MLKKMWDRWLGTGSWRTRDINDNLARVLVAELDTIAQKERFERVGPAQACKEITAMLRVGRLLCGKILVTDMMILDGSYFMLLGPEGVMRELGASDGSFPLTVTGSQKSLALGLESRLGNTSTIWQTGKDLQESATARQKNVWDEWVEFENKGLIRYEQQIRKFELAVVPDLPDCLTNTGNTEILSTLNATKTRSDAFQAIEQSLLKGQDKELVSSWWNSRYLKGIALVAEADWLQFESNGPLDTPIRHDMGSLSLPQNLLQWANSATSATIAVAWDRTVQERRALRKKQRHREMKALCFAAMASTGGDSRSQVLGQSAFKLFVGLALVAIGLPFIHLNALIESLPWIAFAVLVVSTLPFRDIVLLAVNLVPDKQAQLLLFEVPKK